MASEKAMYWAAVGLLALFAGNHFVNRYDGRCLADRAQVVVERLSGQSDRFLAMADVMLGRTPVQFVRAETAVARAQTRLASVQTLMARQQTACARIEGQRARVMALQQVREMRFQLAIPRPMPGLDLPSVVRTPDPGTI